MREAYRELREDVLDEVKAIEEALDRLCKVRSKFDPLREDYSIEPCNGNVFNEFL